MIFKLSLSSVGKKALGKKLFAECCISDTRQRALCRVSKKTLGKETLCRVSKIKHSTKCFFAECFLLPRVFCVALAKELLCRVPKKTLSKEFGTRVKSKIPVVGESSQISIRFST
jgi:hypothetical protein